jgi:voltage-gated potassium channel
VRIDKHHKFMWSFTKSLLASLRRPVLAYLTSLSFTMMAGFSALFFYLEGASNLRLESYFDALYFTVTVMTGVGLGDIAPVTYPGKFLAMCMMLAGTAIFVCFTAVLGASILEIEMSHFSEDRRRKEGGQ